MADSESDHRAIGEVDGTLYKSFSECAPADDGAAVVVLYGSCHDFSGGCGVFAHKNGQAAFGEESATFSMEYLPGCGASFGVYDEVVFLEELISDFESRSQISASVGRKVENEVLHAFFL